MMITTHTARHDGPAARSSAHFAALSVSPIGVTGLS